MFWGRESGRNGIKHGYWRVVWNKGLRMETLNSGRVGHANVLLCTSVPMAELREVKCIGRESMDL